MADEIYDIEVKVDKSALDKADAEMSALKKRMQKGVTLNVKVDTDELSAVHSTMKSLQDNTIGVGVNVDDDDLTTAKAVIEDMETSTVSVDVNVDGDELDELERDLDDVEDKDVNVDVKVSDTGLEKTKDGLDGLKDKNVKVTVTSNVQKLANTFQTLGTFANMTSASMNNIGNFLEGVSKYGTIASGAVLGAGYKGASWLTRSGFANASAVERVEYQLRAQGVDEATVKRSLGDIRQYALLSAFGVTNLGESISDVNAYVGDLDLSTRTVKAFGTSLMATGRKASELKGVGINLGQLFSGEYNKVDYTQLIRGVPAMAQALRDIGVDSWGEFEERASAYGNTLEFVLDAMERYNTKTNAFEMAQQSLSARIDNTMETIEDMLGQSFKDSGLYDTVGGFFEGLGEVMIKNQPLIEKGFSLLSSGLESLTGWLVDFDFAGFFDGLVDGFRNTGEQIKDFYNNHKSIIDKIVTMFTGGKDGAEGWGYALSNLFKGTIGSYALGKFAKGLGTITSLMGNAFTSASSILKFFAGSSVGIPVTESVVGGGYGLAGGLFGGGKGIGKGLLSGFPTIGVNALLLTQAVKQFDDLPSMSKIVTGTAKIGAVGLMMSGLNALKGGAFKLLGVDSLQTSLSSLVDSGVLIGMSYGLKELASLEIPENFDKKLNALQDVLITMGMSNLGSGVVNMLLKAGQVSMLQTVVSEFTSLVKMFAVGGFLDYLSRITIDDTMADKLQYIEDIMIMMTGFQMANNVASFLLSAKNLSTIASALTGLISAGTFMTLIEAVRQLSAMPVVPDIGDKLATIGVIATAISGWNMLTGGIAIATKGLSVVAEAIGFVVNLSRAGTLVLLTSAVKELQGLPSSDTVTTGFNTIKAVLDGISGLNFDSLTGNFFEDLSEVFSAWNASNWTKHMSGVTKNLTESSKFFQEISDLDFATDDAGKTTMAKSVERLQETADALTNMKRTLDKADFGNLFTGFSLSFTENNLKSMNSVVEGISKIESIMSNASSLDVGPGGTIGKGSANLKALVPQLKTLQEIMIGDENIWGNFWSGIDLDMKGNILGSISTNLDTLSKMIDNLKDFEKIDVSKIDIGGVKEIGKAVQDLMDNLDSTAFIGNDQRSAQLLGSVSTIGDVISGLTSVTSNLEKLKGSTLVSASDLEPLRNSIKNVYEGVADISKTVLDGKDLLDEGALTELTTMSGMTEALSSITTGMASIEDSLRQLMDGDGYVDPATIGKTIETITQSITDVFSQIKTMRETLVAQVEEMGMKDSEGGDLQLDGFLEMISTMTGKISEITTQVQSMQALLESLQTAEVDSSNVASSMGRLVESIHEILKSLSSESINEALATIDGSAEGGLAGGVTGVVEQINAFVTQVQSAIEQINSLSDTSATPVGTSLGTALVNGFVAGVDADTMIAPILSAFDTMVTEGTSKAEALSTAVSGAFSTMSANAVAQVNNIISALNSIPTNISVSVNVSSNASEVAAQISALRASASRSIAVGRAVRVATGGLIEFVKNGIPKPRYFAKGGLVGLNPYQSAEKGTDKIPAMLSNREYVLKRQATDFWGVRLLQAMNNRDVNTTRTLMQNKLGDTTRSSVTNNYNYPVVNQHFNSGASNQYLGLRRLVRGV